MDSLHAVLRSIRPETKSATDHLSVFREFLAHLDQLQRRAGAGARTPPRKRATRRAK